MTKDTTTKYTCTIELDIYDDADIQTIELEIERALDHLFKPFTKNINPSFDSIDNVRVSNLYKEAVYIPPTLQENN